MAVPPPLAPVDANLRLLLELELVLVLVLELVLLLWLCPKLPMSPSMRPATIPVQTTKHTATHPHGECPRNCTVAGTSIESRKGDLLTMKC